MATTMGSGVPPPVFTPYPFALRWLRFRHQPIVQALVLIPDPTSFDPALLDLIAGPVTTPRSMVVSAVLGSQHTTRPAGSWVELHRVAWQLIDEHIAQIAAAADMDRATYEDYVRLTNSRLLSAC